MGHWTPTGVEPKDYDDDDDLQTRSPIETKSYFHLQFAAEITSTLGVNVLTLLGFKLNRYRMLRMLQILRNAIPFILLLSTRHQRIGVVSEINIHWRPVSKCQIDQKD